MDRGGPNEAWGDVDVVVPEPAKELHICVPPNCPCVGVRFYKGEDAKLVVAGPGEALARVSRNLVVVITFPLGSGEG